MDSVLLTGGLGYIGSHTAVELSKDYKKIIIFDNLSNSSEEVYEILKKSLDCELLFVRGDVLDIELLESVFLEHDFQNVIHFAGLKSVSESEEKVYEYINVNLTGTKNVIELMKKHKRKNFIFSSSASVYGENQSPFKEEDETGNNLKSIYALSKYLCERYLLNIKDMNIVILRYFNPIGCHPEIQIGEDYKISKNNVFPILLKCIKEKQMFVVFGNDYETKDGTALRDYIHVCDLARAHVMFLNESGVYNVGLGEPVSVLELVNTFNSLGSNVEWTFGERRKGDVSICYASIEKIKNEMKFKPFYTIKEACLHGLNFISKEKKIKNEENHIFHDCEKRG